MKWRDKLAVLMGTAAPFLNANAAGAVEMATPPTGNTDTGEAHKDLLVFVDPAQRDRLVLLAGHSSHASHASHASGSSGIVRGYSDYAPPVYSPPTPPPAPPKRKVQPLFSAPVPTDTTQAAPAGDQNAKRFSKDQLADIIMKVQVALIIRGYDPGPADGLMTPKTKAALSAFQTDNSLAVSGAMDLPTLRLLSVVQ